MVAEDRYGIAQVVLHGREQLVLLRPQANLLVLEVLHYRHQVTQPATLADEAPRMEVSPEELQMARILVKASTADFNLERYSDLYTRKLQQLIEAKVAGGACDSPGHSRTAGDQPDGSAQAKRGPSPGCQRGHEGTAQSTRRLVRKIS
jgi:non-homologous end joining protein Ku